MGCKSGGPAISQVSGNYSGNLLTEGTNQIQQTAVTSVVPALAQGGEKTIAVTDSKGANVVTLTVSQFNDSGLTVTSSVGLSGSAKLKFDVQTGCYFGGAPQCIELCASEPEITFSLNDQNGQPVLSFVLYAEASNGTLAGMETPQSFTLSQAMARAQKMSFGSRIEFEHVIQARATASAAYAHLVPQLTFSTFANNIQPGISSLMAAIGDLAPFLLPSRWIQAKEATDLSEAEQDSERLMRLDMASQVEGLFYAYDRDKRSQQVYRDFEIRVSTILDSVTKNETAGHLLAGSSDTVQAAYNDLTHNDGVFDQILTEDKSALSQSLGFFNPLAVQDATIDQEKNLVETATDLDFANVGPETLARSVEVDQTNDLINQAKLSKKEEYFDWLDPVGNPQLGLGAALPSQLKIAQSQVNELGVVLDQTKSEISEEALNAVTDSNQAVDNFQDAQSDMVLHEHRLSVVLGQLSAGANVDAFDLCSVIADDLGANLALEQARADYRVARAEIDRLLLQGYYQAF